MSNYAKSLAGTVDAPTLCNRGVLPSDITKPSNIAWAYEGDSMSTDTKTYSKVEWLRQAQFANGTIVSVSGKSGLVKIELPASGRRAPMLYADEIQAFIDVAIELQRYLQDHDDVINTKGESLESRKKTQTQLKAQANLAAALEAVPQEVLEKLMAARLAAKQTA